MKRLLIIDDDLDLLMLLQRLMAKHGFVVSTASTGKKGISLVQSNAFDLVLCDFRLPDMEGLDVLKAIKLAKPKTQVIIVTGYSDVRMAVKTVRQGAYDYVTKPILPDEIVHLAQQAIESDSSIQSSGTTTREARPAKAPGEQEFVLGKSAAAKRMQQHIELVAPTEMTVVLQGESGTGKEVAARSIHKLSERSSKPFVAIDCGALPPELAASELFGHTRGAFTGATTNKKGVFESAQGGTIFLDEIGNLTYENQVKLLRVLQERTVRRVGAEKDVRVNVRVLAATNEDLKSEVAAGNFREDLYFRLNEFVIQLPPLRNREEDIEGLANHFLKQANSELNKAIDGYTPEAMAKLREYNWPGNIREMKNMIKRAALLTTQNLVEVSALPIEVVHVQNRALGTAGKVSGVRIGSLKEAIEDLERETIMAVLEHVRFNKSKAAKILEIDRKTLYNKMTAYHIE